MRVVNPTLPLLFGEVFERVPVKVQRMLVTVRSYPEAAPPPPLAGVYVQVVPLSFE